MILKKTIIAIIALTVIAVLTIIVLYFSNYVFPWQKENAINATIEMGGLYKLPQDLENLEVEKRGSMFTRQFIIKFNSSEKAIQTWINQSKRLKSVTPKLKGSKRTFEIYPGENGTFGGIVEINGSEVLIEMSSS